MKWTEAQQAVIDAPSKASGLDSQTLLVPAAAGSGKTAVLVARIVELLKNIDNNISVQDLLVSTFTKAAAAEMRNRIGRKLTETLQEAQEVDQPNQALIDHLEMQLRLLPSAHISTMHAFCTWVIRSYFYKLDIDPTFRVGDEGELGLLQLEVMDKLLESAYEDGQYHIYELADMFSDVKGDSRIRELILSIYNFSRGLDNPTEWLETIKKTYSDNHQCTFKETDWGQAILKEVENKVKTIIDRYKAIKTSVQEEVWNRLLEVDGAFIETFMNLEGAEAWKTFADAIASLQGLKFGTFGVKTLTAKKMQAYIDPEDVPGIVDLRNLNKADIKSLFTSGILLEEDEWQKQMALQRPIVDGLVDLTEAFGQAFTKAKQELGIIDYSDLEHMALDILTEPGSTQTGQRQPSDVAKELQGQFKYVMVDEYQDTSGVQEAIVNLISREDNRFYVGDIKQSIYRFRMADPSLFVSKYKSFSQKEDALCRRIDLDQNFRSHQNILATTNFIFRQIMSNEATDLNYGDEESLKPGRIIENPPSDWCAGSVELHLIDCAGSSSEKNGVKYSQEQEKILLEGQSIEDTISILETSSADDKSSDKNSKHTTLVKKSMEDDIESDFLELENFEKEVQFIISKIKELKAKHTKVEDKQGNFRDVQYKDIAILLRSTSAVATRMVEMLREAGIPAYAEEKGGYFDALEVKLILALLQVIDNPEQDLPLAAVLHSGLVGMDANQLGQLRMSGTGSLWSVLPSFAEKHENVNLQVFVRNLQAWRTFSRRHGVSDLIWDIYEKLDYVNYVSTMPNGIMRRANVLALYNRAKEYESGAFTGIFRFLRFIENLRKSGEDLGMAKTVSEADDVVRIMTIHKSKGLQFPIVFLSNAQKRFNQMDFRSPVLMHKDAGLGVKGYYPSYRVMYKSIPWVHTYKLLDKEAKAEEERLLYVAMTRAQDKLYITSFVKNFDSLCTSSQIKAAVLEGKEKFSKELILQGNSYLDWIMMAFSRHLLGHIIRRVGDIEGTCTAPIGDHQCDIKIVVHDGDDYSRPISSRTIEKELFNRLGRLESIKNIDLDHDIINRFNFIYPYEIATKREAKISVSEIKRRFEDVDSMASDQKSLIQVNEDVREDSEDSQKYLKVEALDIFSRKPQVLEDGEQGITGTRWGTLMHSAMQWIPVRAYTQQELKNQLDILQAKGYFTEEERNLLSDRSLYKFFSSDLGRRMIQSKRVEKELPFSMLYDGKRVYKDLNDGENLFLQGIIDTIFLEGDQWVLVDYKTDRAKSREELISRYKIQLDLYKEALERLTPYKVKETYIYSFRLHDAVLIK